MNITQIELPLKSTFPTVNCYLAAGDQLSIIDTGTNLTGNWELFCKSVQQAGYQVSDIDNIILTHHHKDHVSLLTNILDNSQATVIAPKLIEHWLYDYRLTMNEHILFVNKTMKTVGFPEAIGQMVFHFLKKEMEDGLKINISPERIQFIEDGDQVNIGGEMWQAIHTPEHTINQFCFFDEKNSQILGGDMLLPLAPMPILDEGENGSRVKGLPMLMHSFQRLKKYNFQKVYTGHGQPFEEANKVIDQQIQRINKRKIDCLLAIKQGNQTIFDIVNAIYPTNNGIIHFGGLFMTFGYIDLLEAEGKVMVEHGKTLIVKAV